MANTDHYLMPYHRWYDVRNWRLWAAISSCLLTLSVGFALVTTTRDRDAARADLASIASAQRCRSKAANAVSTALIDKIIDIGDVQDVIGQFVIGVASEGSQTDYGDIVERLGAAIEASEHSGTTARRAVEAQRTAVEACEE